MIPKAPARNLLDISVDDYLHVARSVHRVARAARTAFDADGLTIQQFNELAGGQVVFHLHVHVMPRQNGVALLPPMSNKVPPRRCRPMPRACCRPQGLGKRVTHAQRHGSFEVLNGSTNFGFFVAFSRN